MNLKIWLIIGFCCALSSCADTSENDTNYELIQGSFPRLNDVPERPLHPPVSELEHQQYHLLKSSHQAKTIKQETFAANNIQTTEQTR